MLYLAQPMQRIRQLAFICFVAFVGVAGFSKEGFTSGGGEITIEHPQVKLHFETPRKRPMPGEEAEYGQVVAAWEKSNQPVAEKVIKAIETALPKYRKQVTLVAESFNRNDLSELSAEGTLRRGYTDDTGPYLLTIDLDVYPGGHISTRVQFVVAKRPTKTALRGFARAVQAATVESLGRTLPPPPTYTAYWLTAQDVEPVLLLSTVPLSKLTETLQAAPWRPMSFETFRVAPALLLTTHNKQFVTGNKAGFLLANPTAAKFDTAADTVILQVNGNYLAPMTVRQAKRAEALQLLAHPVDTSLTAAQQAEARKANADNIDFLDSLKPALAK